jgi:hypothetical protein
MKHLKINLKLRQFPWNTYFFQIFKIDPLSVVLNHNEPGPKGPMPHGKGLRECVGSRRERQVCGNTVWRNIYLVLYTLTVLK